MPLQSNLETTDKMARYIEEELKKEKSIQYYTTNVGKGNPRIYYNVIPKMKNPTLHSSLYNCTRVLALAKRKS
jgi:multidrug efflux pump subunit AcrB